MNKRQLNVASLIINLTIVILTAYSVAHNFRTDIIRNVDTVNDTELTNFTGFLSFRYFTTLSNVFSAVAAGITLFFNVKNVVNDDYFFPKWVIVLKYVATCSVALTFIIVSLVLSPLVAIYGKSYFTLFKSNSFFMHFLNPMLAVTDFTVFERKYELNLKYAAVAVVPTVAYSVVYTVMVVGFKVWPDFYGFTFNGTFWALPLVIAGMFAISFGISSLIYLSRKKLIRNSAI